MAAFDMRREDGAGTRDGPWAKPRYEDIPGAPFRIGDRVVVTEVFDDNRVAEKTMEGRKGTVAYFEYDCGSGQAFPHDPMIGLVEFPGVEFWSDELRLTEDAAGTRA